VIFRPISSLGLLVDTFQMYASFSSFQCYKPYQSLDMISPAFKLTFNSSENRELLANTCNSLDCLTLQIPFRFQDDEVMKGVEKRSRRQDAYGRRLGAHLPGCITGENGIAKD
jgi:hypothetical protein